MRPKKSINVRIGMNIQTARERSRYTQEELSERVGVSPNHLSAVERGAAGASFELLEKLCNSLCVSADELIFGKVSADSAIPRLAQQLAEASSDNDEAVRQILTALLSILKSNDEAQQD